jgi:DNA uptake protein ComE-like DNA-binding protein
MRTALFAVSLCWTAAACVAEEPSELAQAVAGTPDELALVRFLADPTTTLAVLDEQVPLDRRAAQNLIAHRELDPFDTAAEIDAVPYVGPAAMDALVAYAVAGDWVSEDELFGTFDGVAFTVSEARAAVDLADQASEAELRGEVGLDARAARNVVAARPVRSMSQLAAVPYVGPVMMGRIHAAVAAPAACSDGDLVARIDAASDGMWLLSESDYPLDPVAWPDRGAAAASPAAMLELLGLPATTPIRVKTFDRMMERLGYSNDEAQVAALRALMEEHLTGLVFYEVGEIQVHDYVVGVSACGGLVGFTTISIET